MEDLTLRCTTGHGDSANFRDRSDGEVAIAVDDSGRRGSNTALVDIDAADARRLRDWLTAWLAEQEGEEPEAEPAVDFARDAATIAEKYPEQRAANVLIERAMYLADCGLDGDAAGMMRAVSVLAKALASG